MNYIKSVCFFVIIFLLNFSCSAQSPVESIVMSNIHSVRFSMYNDQLSRPIYRLNSADKLELDFDDLDGDVKSYYYTFQLCDVDWNPSELSAFDFTKGFTESRITTYRNSSIAYTNYTHYQVVLPEATSIPTKSGNYILKVYLDGDTTKLAFTRCLYVLDSRCGLVAQVMQPFSPQIMNSYQRIKLDLNINGLDAFDANQEIKLVVIQNNRWDKTIKGVHPTFIRGNLLEYDSENDLLFPGGNEWRWLDMRSLKLQGDRVRKANYKKDSTDVFVKTDGERASQRYLYFQDFDGKYEITTYENINPFWQSDYATVHFTFYPPEGKPYQDKDIYLFGQLTDYQLNENNRMNFNEEKRVYENSQFLKQGFYNYGYVLVNKSNPENREEVDGDHFETENNYTILVYYKSFSDRVDELIGITKVNSMIYKTGQ